MTLRGEIRGASLLQSLLVLMLLALTLGWGLPQLRRGVMAQRTAAAARALEASLQLARTEALLHAPESQVSVVPRAGTSNWAEGWSVIAHPADGDPTQGVAPRGLLLEVVELWPGVSAGQTGRAGGITFHGAGQAITDGRQAVAQRTIWFEAPGVDRHCLILNTRGRVRTARVAPQATCHEG